MVLTLVFSFLGNNFVAYAYDKNYEMHLVPISHIDTAWMWPYVDVAQNVIPDTWYKQIGYLKNNPELRFTISAIQHLAWSKEYYPDMWEDIRELYAEGRIEIVGGQLVEPDTNTPSGESHVRQFLIGQKFLEENFGKKTTVGFLPDCFGFSGQYPQIMKKSGIDYFVTAKLTWNDTNKFPYNLFFWKGIDGSSVLSYLTTKNYDHVYSDEEIEATLDALKPYGVTRAYGSFGAGDHGGGPSLADYEKVLNQDKDPANPHVILSSATRYFDSVSKDDLSKVPTWEGEMYLEYHRGTYTSWARQKLENRKSEIAAEVAEKAGAIGTWLGVTPDTGSVINDAWWKIAINHMHDVQPGSSVPMAYEESFNFNEIARNKLNTVANYGLQAMAYRADTSVESGVPVFVFNPLSWTRDDMVEATLKFDTEIQFVRIYDQNGNEMPCEVLETDGNTATIRFEARDIPSLGYKLFRAVPADKPYLADTGLIIDEENLIMENQYYKVVFNPETGNITHIYNKKDNNRDVLNSENGEGNELQIFTDTGGTSWPAWDLIRSELSPVGGDPYDPTYRLGADSLKSIEVIENSSVKAVIRVTREWSKSTFIQDIIMYPDVERIDVKTYVDWRESNRMLKVSFPLSAVSNTATYEIAYGALQRSTNRDTSFDGARFEHSGQKWADITNESDNAFGVSILNDSKYGWDVYRYKDNSGTRIRLSLLRSARTASSAGYGYSNPASYPAMDQGPQYFTYSIYPHKGDWTEAQSVQRAYELNYPVIAFQTEPHEGVLGKEFSFIDVNEPNIIASVVKTPYDGGTDELIVRLYESQGKDSTEAHIKFPADIKNAKEVNILEEDYEDAKPVNISGNTLTANFGKYEIKTLRVDLGTSEYGKVTQKTASVDLYTYYNLDGISSDNNRSDGDVDGSGNSYAAELWPERITFQGVPFKLGPAADGYKNLVRAEGQEIKLPVGNYKYVYILGAASGTEANKGEFVVRYADSTSTRKNITFAQWNTMITSWDAVAAADIRPVVKDTIAYDFTHYHMKNRDNYVKESFLFLYKIPIDPEKNIESLILPNAKGIKIAAISLADSEFLRAAQLPDGNESIDDQKPSKVTDVKAELQEDSMILVDVSWEASTDNDGIKYYRIYRGIDPDFLPDESTFIDIVSGTTLNYTDSLNASGTYYYKIIAIDTALNMSEASDASNPVTGGLDNAFLTSGVKATANGSMATEPPEFAIDGTTANNSKWCYNGGNNNASETNPYWLIVDLGNDYEKWSIYKFVVMHAQAGGESSSWNTKDFTIQMSNDRVNWTTLFTITGNTSGVTTHDLALPVTARYFKLNITHPGQANCARIYEFQAYGKYNGLLPPTAKDVNINVEKKKGQPLVLTGTYTFVPGFVGKTELGSTYKWYGETGDNNFTLIEGETEISLEIQDDSLYRSIKFEVTPADSSGARGMPVISPAIYIAPGSYDDRAYLKKVTATSQTASNEAAEFAVDHNNTTKWCATQRRPQSLTVDMGHYYSIDKFVVTHAKIYEPYYANTYAYNIYMSDSGVTWNKVYSVDGNTDTVNTLILDTPVTGRYVKLEITKTSENDDTAVRIYGFEAWGYPDFDYTPIEEGEEEHEPADVEASDVAITGVAEVNGKLTGNYTIAQEYEKYCRFRWLWSNEEDGIYEPIYNANGKVYTPTEEMEGKYLKFEVRVGLGRTVTSDPVLISAQTPVNILIGCDVSADVEAEEHEANNAVDGDDSTYWFARNYGGTLLCKLDSLYKISRFVVMNAGSAGLDEKLNTKDFEIYVSDNGEDWVEAAVQRNNTASEVTINLTAPLRAKYIKLHVTTPYSSIPAGAVGGIYIVEFEAYGTPYGASVPRAFNVKVPSSAETNKLLVASYSFSDPNGEWEGESILQWMAGDSVDGPFYPIPGATSLYYRPSKDVAGKYIKFTVKPVNKSGIKGATASSEAIMVENARPRIEDIVVIGDTTIESKRLKVTYRYVDYEDDPEGNTTYQWYMSDDGRNWTEIIRATESTLNLSEVANIKQGITSLKCRIIPEQIDGKAGYAADSNAVVITPAGYNALKGATIVDYSGYVNSSESPEKLVDGDYTTKWCDTSTIAPSDRDPKRWVTMDMGSQYPISTFVLRNCRTMENFSNTRAFRIQTSTDGVEWFDAYRTTTNTDDITVVQFSEPVQARYVRLAIDETATPRIYEVEAWTRGLATTLNIAPNYSTTIANGDTFELQYGVSISSPYFELVQEDVKIAYDPEMFIFKGYKLLDDYVVVDNINDDGNGTIELSLTHIAPVNGNYILMNLEFEAKAMPSDMDEKDGTISVSGALFTNTVGTESEARLSNVKLTVMSSKRALNAAIDIVKLKLENAVIGVEPGNYFKAQVAKLSVALGIAQNVHDSPESGESDYILARLNLLNALKEFENSVITDLTGDLDGDGEFTINDLNDIIIYYGMNVSELINYEKLADIDGNGYVGLTDFIFVAQKILGN